MIDSVRNLVNITAPASTPFYLSGTFWAVAVFAVSLLGIAVAWGIWRLGAPRRLLVYSSPESTSLLTWHAERFALGDVTISHKNRAVRDPYLVLLKVESKSRTDISSDDFDGGKPLVFDFGTRIIAPVGRISRRETPVNPEIFSICESTVEIGPCLIHKGPVVFQYFLTEGPPYLDHKSSLKDVKVAAPDIENEFPWYGALGIAIFLAIFLIGIPIVSNLWLEHILNQGNYQHYRNSMESVAHFTVVVGLVLIPLIVCGTFVGYFVSRSRARSAREAARKRRMQQIREQQIREQQAANARSGSRWRRWWRQVKPREDRNQGAGSHGR